MMGFTDFINKFKKQKENKIYADMLNGYIPVYSNSQFGNDIYASDVVQQAISCIVFEMKKLNILHVRSKMLNDCIPVSNSHVQWILDNPNPYMTQSEFIEKIYWLLFLNHNAFIIPTYDIVEDKEGNMKKKYTGLYPIQPQHVEFLQDTNTKILYIKFVFSNKYETTLKYEDIIHLKYKFSVNQYMGGDEFGHPDNKALLKTLEMNETLLQGVAKSLKASYSVNAVVKYKSLIDKGKTEENIKKMEKILKDGESGFLPLDIGSDFIPIQRQLQNVDDKTLKFIDEKILRNFGVPLSILLGDYSKETYEAFYQKSIEHLVISGSQSFSKGLFSDNERRHGNMIKFFVKELIFMSVNQKLEMIRLLGDTGSLYENEKRMAFGYMPLAELEGKRMQSLNYVDVDIAVQYQINEQKNKGKEKGVKDD